MIGARIQGTFPTAASNAGIADLGDGLWAHDAAISMSSVEFVDNARAGIARARRDLSAPRLARHG